MQPTIGLFSTVFYTYIMRLLFGQYPAYYVINTLLNFDRVIVKVRDLRLADFYGEAAKVCSRDREDC